MDYEIKGKSLLFVLLAKVLQNVLNLFDLFSNMIRVFKICFVNMRDTFVKVQCRINQN